MKTSLRKLFFPLAVLGLLFFLPGILFAQTPSCSENNIGFNNNTSTNTLAFCQGVAGTTINGGTPNGNPGYVWEVSTTGPASGFSTAAGATATNQNYTISSSYYNTPGTYYFRRFVDKGPCSGYSDVVTLTVRSLPTPIITITETSGNITNDGIICSGESVTLTASGAGTGGIYKWDNNPANGSSTTISPTSTTPYKVTITDANGCIASLTATITVNQNPTASITVAETSGKANNDGIICSDAPVTLTASGAGTGGSYTWSTNETMTAITVNPPTDPASTTYSVTAKDANGCVSTVASTTITVNPRPAIDFTVTPGSATCVGTNVTYTTNSGNTNYNWQMPGSSASDYSITTGGTANDPTVILKWLTAGDHTLSVNYRDALTGCLAAAAVTHEITVNAVPTLSAVSTTTTTVCSGSSATITLTGLLPNTTQTINYMIAGRPTTETTTVTSDASGEATFSTIGLGQADGGKTLTITGITRMDVSPACSYSPTGSTATLTLPSINGGLIAPVLTRSPNTSSVCEGQTLTFTVASGSGGSGTIEDQYRYSTDGGTNWSDWAVIDPSNLPNITAIIGTTIVETRRYASETTCNYSGSNTISWQVVEQPVVTNPAPDNQQVCKGNSVTPLSVSASGGTGTFSYQWYRNTTNSTTGGTPIGTNAPTYTPSVATVGTFYYYCVITQTGGNCGPVTTSETAIVESLDQPSPGTLTKGLNAASVCADGSVSATATEGDGGSGTIIDYLQYRYDATGQWNDYTSGESLPVTGHNSVEIRTYRIASGSACQQSPIVTVSWTVDPLPTPSITFSETSGNVNNDGIICSGDPVTLNASGAGGGGTYLWDDNIPGSTHSVTPAVETPYKLTAITSKGCTASIEKKVEVNTPPTPVITATDNSGLNMTDGVICTGGSVALSASGAGTGGSYVWGSNAGNATTAIVSNLQPTVSTNYSVTVKDANGCSSLGNFNVVVNALPTVPAITGSTSVCIGGTTTLANTSAGGVWSSSNPDLASINSSSGVVTGVATGTPAPTISYTITDANNCTNSASTTVTVNPNNTITLSSAAGTDAQTKCISTPITNITYTTTGATGIGSPLNLPAGVTAAFNSGTITILGTPTATGTFNYTIPLTGGCGTMNATGTITVQATSVGGTIAPAITTVCANAAGGTLNLSGVTGSIVRWEYSTNGGTTWTTIANTTATQSYTTTGTRLYRAVVQNGVCGEIYSSNAVISVIPAATIPTASASPATICAGQIATLSATAAGFMLAGGIDGTFNRANPEGWCVDGKCTGDVLPAPGNNASTFPWSETNGPKSPFGGEEYNNLQTDGKFAITSGQINTIMETPVFSTIGMTSATLQFYQALIFAAGASAKIEISTNGGANYTRTLIQYNGPLTIGVPANNWDLLKLDLSDYIGLSNLRIRFTYSGANNSNWAIDGFGFPGQAAPVTYQWTPTATLTPSTGQGPTVTANPTVTTTYTVTTTINGCPGGSQQVTVNVNPVTVITAQPTGGQADGSGLYCETATINPLTVTATGTAPLSYQWYSMAGATPAPATDPKVGTNSNSFTPPKTVGTTTYYVVVTGGCGSQTSTAVPVTIVPPLVLSQLAPAEALCYQSQVNLRIVASVPANVATYQWYRAAGTTPAPATDTKIGTNSPTYTIPSLTPADNGNYYVVVTGKSPCNEVLTSNVVTVTSYTTDVTIWTSGDDTDEWHEDLNWTCGIPTLYKDAIVPIVPNNKYPYIDGTSGLVGQTRKLTIDAGGPSVSVDGLLQMAGEVTNNGTLNGYLNGVNSTGTIEFVSNINFSTQYPNNSTYAQQLVSTAGTPVTQTQNLKISNLVTITIPVDVYGQLSFGGNNKTLATNDKLTLKSVSEMATAMVTDPTHGTGISQGNVINGKATVERYIPAYGTRKWRLVTSPVKGVSINSSWQEGRTWNNGMAVENGNKFGTLITGGSNFATAGAANAAGFDFWPLPLGATSSVRDYSGSGDLVSNDLATWPQMASTLTPNAFDDHRTYLVYVRGDRSVSTGSVAGWTVLRAKGLLKEELTHQIPLMPQSHTMFGNPYASPLDYKLIYNANSGKIQPYFWIWQARLAGMYGLGGYVLMLPDGTNTLYEAIPSEASGSASVANRMVHSGQGIFVMPQTSPAPTFPTSITIAQTHKSTTLPGISAFRQMGPGPSKIYINLQVTDQTNAATLMDGGLAQYDASFANGKGFNIAKAINSGENLSIFKGGKDLIVASDILPSIGDTLRFRIWNTNSSRAYQLKITGLNFLGTGLSAILVDKYLGKEKELNINDDSTFYSFNLTGQPGARDPQRFYIVFRASQAPLPLVISELGAEEQPGGEVLVSWKVEDETGIKLYEVEKSGDGTRFQKLSEQPARAGAGPQAYESLDGSPSAVTYYRIRMTGVGGEVKYSDVVKVQLSSRREAVVLHPNPLNSGEALQVQLQNKPAGVYRLTLFNDQGQRVWSQSLQHSGGTATQVTDLPGSLSSGHYKLELRHTSGKTDMLSLHILK